MTDQHTPDLGEPVTVAWVADGRTVDYNFFHCWTQLLGHDQAHHARVWQGGFIDMRCGTDGLPDARNKAINIFLSEEKSQWLLWLDTDMGFKADVVDRLFEVADPAERPVVGALCFASIEGEVDGFGGWHTRAVPTVFDWAHDGGADGFAARFDYPRDAVVQCAGTGSACILIHRRVFEAIRAEFGPNWYTRTRNPSTGEMISEDLSFCIRANALQLPIYVHTGVKTTHAKPMWLSEELYWQQRAVTPAPWTPDKPAAFRRVGEQGPEPVNLPAGTEVKPVRTWTVPRYAIIPTHNRPQRLLALIASLGRQCDHIVVLDNASEPPVDRDKLQMAAGPACEVYLTWDAEQPPHLSRFWNLMLDRVATHAGEAGGADQWDVAILNDDAIVPAGWYDACSNALRAHPTAVIAHTTPTTPALLTELHNQPNNRMTPHAFVIRGEVGLRADEDMRWWYFDSDLDQRARLAGGVLSVPGPRVVNSLANSTTRGPLAEQAEKDRATFEAKWSA